MRKYITEKVGIVEFFQIIVTVVILILGLKAFSTDYNWNTKVDNQGINLCVELNNKIVDAVLVITNQKQPRTITSSEDTDTSISTSTEDGGRMETETETEASTLGESSNSSASEEGRTQMEDTPSSNHKIYFILNEECPSKLHIPDKNSSQCSAAIDRLYLKKTKNKFEIRTKQNETKNIEAFMRTHVKRQQMSELIFLALVSLITFLLVSHMFMASCSKNIELRTKWNAALHVVVLFIAGFSAVLLAISVNSIDTKYNVVSQKLQPCGMLRYCDKGQGRVSDFGNTSLAQTLDDALNEIEACQEVFSKKAMSVMLLILITMCAIMILMAMDLTTKYEEELDEQELERETAEGLEILIEDQNVVFETSRRSFIVDHATAVLRSSGNQGQMDNDQPLDFNNAQNIATQAQELFPET